MFHANKGNVSINVCFVPRRASHMRVLIVTLHPIRPVCGTLLAPPDIGGFILRLPWGGVAIVEVSSGKAGQEERTPEGVWQAGQVTRAPINATAGVALAEWIEKLSGEARSSRS
jgi:hypothetical protein